MKKIVITLMGLILILIQLTITNRLKPLGVSIDLLLIYAVIMAVYLDTKTSYICVSILGIVQDSLISTVVGVNLVILLLTTYVVKLFIDLLHEEKLWSIALLFLFASLISVSIHFLVNQIFFVALGHEQYLNILLKKTALNIGIGLVMTILIRPIFNHIMKNWW